MNERIEKLAQRVDLLGQFVPTKKPGRYAGYITEEQILEFAELIVRECMKVADEGMAQVTMKVEWPSYHIKKHFGVDE